MGTNVTLNGSTYTIPASGESNWGTNVSNYLIAIASSCLQKTGGSFTLTGEIDFGATYGLKSAYFKSRATNPSSTGVVRLGNNEGISWRNAANNADVIMKLNSDDDLEYNGSLRIGDAGTEGAGIDIGGVTYNSSFKVSDINGSNYAQTILHRHSTTLEPVIVGARSNSNTSSHADVTAGMNLFTVYGVGTAGSNYKIFSSINFGASSSGTISNTSAPGMIRFYTTPDGSVTPGLALKVDQDKSATFYGSVNLDTITASRALVSGSGKNIEVSATTAAELAYLSGVTSAIQTQLNAKAPNASPTFSGTITTPLTASRALVTGASSELGVSATTATELSYLSGVTSAVQTQINAISATTVPSGAIFSFGGSTAPSGYQLCYGQAISRTTYAALFAAISTTYGVGDGSTTFNLPDLRGRSVFGKDNMGGTTASRVTSGNSGITGTTLGAAGGLETLMAHTHGPGTLSTGNQSSNHTHTYSVGATAGGSVPQTGAYNYASGFSPATSGVSSDHTHTVTSGATGSTGTGSSHGNMPPAMILNYIIKE